MPLSAGDKLGHYEVLSLLGKGGMGEVFRVRDTTLKRDVALKVLPATFLRDPERMARFQREAEVLASLDHPNIGPIYGLVDSADSRGLVLALIEGPTLADRIEAGPIPLDEALAISKQIIAALEYAHDRGVVHRDLKPANIKITSDGVVKVLDFGLAKVLENEPPPSSPDDSPTLTVGHTRTGVILGTAAYMSPEQAIGRPIDRRSDIFSFGAVLYEMLTGKQPFTGTTTPDVLEAVVKTDPDWSALPAETPGYLRRLLERTLAKDRKQRLQAIGEARIALEHPDRSEPRPTTAPAGAKLGWMSRFGWAGWGLAALAIPIAMALSFVHFREAKEELYVTRTSFPLPDKIEYASLPAISPDGRHVVFAGAADLRTQLWIRDLDSLEARPLPDTDGADYPFWSPDSRFVAFGTGSKLKKVGIGGGPALTLCDSTPIRGGTWSKDDVVLFAGSSGGLYRVPAAGGKPAPVTTPDPAREETSDRFPWFLPDGRHFLFTAVGQDLEKVSVYVGDLDSNERRPILTGATGAVYAPPGYLLFMREQTLLAQPFDPRTLGTTGEAVPVAERVNFQHGRSQGDFSASQNGALVYGSAWDAGAGPQLSWLDRSGKVKGIVGKQGMSYALVSPDGTAVGETKTDPQTGKSDIWLYDLERDATTLLTHNTRQNDGFVWSPDGKEIAFRSWRSGVANLFLKATNGTGNEQVLDDAPGNKRIWDWSRDGRYIIEDRGETGAKREIWILPRFGDRRPFRYEQSDSNEWWAKLSPDGQWLAYKSNADKRPEIYVSAFPVPQGRWRVSTNGTLSGPVWGRNGRELFFVGADHKMMAVEIKPGSKFSAGAPTEMFVVPQGSGNNFDVGKDGNFLLGLPTEHSAPPPIVVVSNWQAGLRK